MIRAHTLFQSALLRIDRIDHPTDVPHVDPDEELTEHYSISLLERGEFSVRHRNRDWHVTPHDFFVTGPGHVYRYTHDERTGPPTDVCVSVSFTDASCDEIAALIGPLDRCATTIPLNNRRAYLRGRLFGHLVDAPTPMTLDLLAGELLVSTFDTDGHPLYGRRQLWWYARRVDRARRQMDEDFQSDYTLARLANDAGMSPFHFARVFRALTGVPPHQYLIGRRLVAAKRRLHDGGSVTDTCFAVGFRSLSHFITSFRRAFGVSPSKIDGHTDPKNAPASRLPFTAATDTTSS